MKTTKLVLAGLTAALTLASGAALAEQYSDRARVISATPEYDRVNVPRQECYDEYQPQQAYGERSYGGSVIGGITGAIVGDRLQNQNIDDNRGSRSVRRCRDIDRWENRIAGYRVVYEYGGHRYTTMMPNSPGNYVRVRVSVDAYED